MPGLRNSGIDTSAWYLAGFSGTELLVNDPRFIDPEAVFGGNLPPGPGPAPVTYPFDARYAHLDAFDGTVTQQLLTCNAWTPTTNYVYAHPDRFPTTLPALSSGVSTPAAVPHYSASNVRDGLYHFSSSEISGFPRGTLDLIGVWIPYGLTAVAFGNYGIPGAWNQYSRLTASVGTDTAFIIGASANFTGSTSGALHYAQCVVRKPAGSTAEQVFVGVYDPATGLAASGTGIYVNLDTGAITKQNLNGTVVVAKARELPEGWFVQCGLYWSAATPSLRSVWAFAKGGSLTASWTGTEVMDMDWVGKDESSVCIPPIITAGTFSFGGVLGNSFLSLTPTTPASVVAASGFTFYVDFEIDSHSYVTDATEWSTPFRLTGTGGTVRISFVPSTKVYRAKYFNAASVLQADITWSPAEGVRQRVVLRCNNNDFSLHVNGAVIGTDSSGTLSTGDFSVATGVGFAAQSQPTLIMYRMSLGPLISSAEATAASSTGW